VPESVLPREGIDMFAAIPTNQDKTLELFVLALKSVKNEKVKSEKLRQYFETIVREALRVLEDPQNISEKTRPESIRLAIEMKTAENIGEKLNQIIDDGRVNPIPVEQILSEAEHRFAF
jgi:hypothetical protein